LFTGTSLFLPFMKQLFVTAILFFLILISACKKESFTVSRDAAVALTADTLRFDTVFTSVGSITQLFKIKNDNSQKLLLSKVSLKGGAGSSFKINVDGVIGPDVTNIEMEANDSIYVFVSVSINPNVAALPFVIRDSIEIEFNGNKKKVQLEAWGQNGHFLRGRKITGNVTWTNNLPYIILGGLQVDTDATLTIEKGCRIYLHADAPFFVDGTLKITGEKNDSARVYFSSDRLDVPYNDFPGSWPGIYFRGKSKDNVLQYAVIKNAYQGIVAEQPSINANPKLTLNECVIDNIYDAGILGIQSSITARNCLISNCGKNVVLAYGGDYQFTHCTAVAISNNYISHKDPALFLSNNARQGNTILTSDLTASFSNCIFWGENGTAEDEVVISKQGTTAYSVSFKDCLWKVKTNPSNITTATNVINNQSPLFDSINTEKRFFNFRLRSNSPAINKGSASSVSIDLDGKPRPMGLPDLGCYEKQ
jgi:cytoskeletal protein CcmA (bactofilin family)